MPIGLWTTARANAVEKLEPERKRPAFAEDLLAGGEMHSSKSRSRVRRLGRGVDAEHDPLDLAFGLGGPGRHGGHLVAVARERGVASSVDRNRRLRVQCSSTVARRREWKSATNRLRKYLVVGSSGSACAVAAS